MDEDSLSGKSGKELTRMSSRDIIIYVESRVHIMMRNFQKHFFHNFKHYAHGEKLGQITKFYSNGQ